MTVMAEAAVADDGLPLLTVGYRRKCTYPKGKNLAKKQGTKFFLFLKNHTLRCKSVARPILTSGGGGEHYSQPSCASGDEVDREE